MLAALDLSSISDVLQTVGLIASLFVTLWLARKQSARDEHRLRVEVADRKRDRLVANYPSWATAMGRYAVHRGAFKALVSRLAVIDEKLVRLHESGQQGEEYSRLVAAADYNSAKKNDQKDRELEASQELMSASLSIRMDDRDEHAKVVADLTRQMLAWDGDNREVGPRIAAESVAFVEIRIAMLKNGRA